MTGRWGLQAKMTATYVAVTAGAVLLTELVIFGAAALSPPAPLSVPEILTRVTATAQGMAAKLAREIAAGRLTSPDLGVRGVPGTPGKAQPDSADGVIIPWSARPECDLASASLATIVSRTGTVLATSYPACYPAGGRGSTADAGAPRKMLTSFSWPAGGSGRASVPSGDVLWAAAPVVLAPPGGPKAPSPAASPGSPGATVVGMLYLEVPAAGPGTGGFTVSPALERAGLVLLAVAIPAGLAFGLLSTRRLIRRLKRLAALSLEVADGGFDHRLPVSGYDEMSQLEENFNRMAGQLQASLDARRQLAEANARHQERSRIARELHDSISQELFSLSVMAGGLRRTLPTGSTELAAVEIMERTAGDTMREMRSLLLALRPVALEEAGLASAIKGVCHAYTERLGVPVQADLEPVAASPALEHALLRVTQEALANAVRHAGADLIAVRLRTDDDQVVLEITDDGTGFDRAARQANGGGLGLRAIRDRVAEHDGRLTIDSAPGAGTVVRASFPGKPR